MLDSMLMNESREVTPSYRAIGERHPFAMLLPIMLVVLGVFLIIGLALPVLPLHVHPGLGLGAFVVGLVAGSQFAASLISRVWSRQFADTRGAKGAVTVGLLTATAGGIVYLLSLLFVDTPRISVAILLLGRALLGAAESFIITGALSSGLALVGAESAGKVMAWVGTAMFAALAVGAPIGTALYGLGGFAAIGLATALVPLIALLLAAAVSAVPPQRGHRPSLIKVAGAVWIPGVGAALSSIGFGAILAFGALLLADRGWSPVWLPFSAFAISLIVARVLFGHLPDRLGGAQVALVSVFVEAAGLALIWWGPAETWAAVGAVFTGIGYSLVYPGFGVEAVRRAPLQSRGLAVGAYTAFLDVALGLGSPALGLVAGSAGLGVVFLTSALAVTGAAFVAVRLMNSPAHPQGNF
jgi:MFS family permease